MHRLPGEIYFLLTRASQFYTTKKRHFHPIQKPKILQSYNVIDAVLLRLNTYYNNVTTIKATKLKLLINKTFIYLST